MDHLIELAKRLGKQMASHENSQLLKQAQQNVDSDALAKELVESYQKQAQKITDLEEQQKPIEIEDKHQLSDLQQKIATHAGLAELTRRQVDFLDMMRKIRQAIDSELEKAIGIVKGKPFKPDARMKKLLTEAVAIGNATARAIVFQPREKDAYIYPDSDSGWVMVYAGKDVFFEVDGARNLDARTMFHYPYTAVTPAMAIQMVGVGSQYAIAAVDADGNYLDGSKTYSVTLPTGIPAKDFWSFVIYDPQTRSLLQTPRTAFPSLSSQSGQVEMNADGSSTIWFGPEAPAGKEQNWIQTVPGKGWFVILRLYGPLESWFDRTWRPGELEPVN
ncbi:MAG: DUF1214 domain-containing protein [Bacteroidetes bacterium]|nr:DUF1214 domain-containing protein [Bacteroidota bacterium]